jgi:hypothetical protein
LRAITTPKISRDDKSYYCEVGRFVFIRDGWTEETPKLTSQIFSLLLNGKVIETVKSYLDKVSFAKRESYLHSTLTCRVEVSQENLTVSSHSINASISASHALTKKKSLAAADAKYYLDRQDANAKKVREFARILKIKNAVLAASKSTKEIMAASAAYQQAFKEASDLWKKELAGASANRKLSKDLAEQIYLNVLEAAGISISPTSN